MKKPQNPASENSNASADPKPAGKKNAAKAPVIAVSDAPDAAATKKDAPTPLPAADSTLIGTPRSHARPPAEPKDQSVTSPSKNSSDKPATPPAEPIPTPKPAPEARVEVRRTGFMPVFLGGVVAAGLGAAAAYYAIPHLPAAWQPVPPATLPDPEAQLQAARDAAEGVVAGHQAQLLDAARQAGTDAGTEAAKAALADIPAAPAADPAAAQGIVELEKNVADQAQRLDALAKGFAVLTAPGAANTNGSTAGLGSPAPEAIQALQATVAQLEARVDDLATQRSADPEALAKVQALGDRIGQMQQEIETAAQSADQQIAAAQAEAQKVREETATVARRASIAAIAAGMKSALESGGSLQGGLADLQAAGIEMPAAISGEIPTLPVLQRGFDDAARKGLRASLRAEATGEDAMGAIGNFLRVQTGARSIEPQEGTDPDAVLSRAAAAVRTGDIPAALTEIATLPAPGQEAMSDWTAQAGQWVAARAAIADLASSLK